MYTLYMDYKEILGFASTIIAIISYLPYLNDIATNKTKPHTITWLIWGILTTIAFVGQIADNAGPGAWVTGITAFICTAIAVISIIKDQVKIVTLDWLSLIGATVALLFW